MKHTLKQLKTILKHLDSYEVSVNNCDSYKITTTNYFNHYTYTFIDTLIDNKIEFQIIKGVIIINKRGIKR